MITPLSQDLKEHLSPGDIIVSRYESHGLFPDGSIVYRMHQCFEHEVKLHAGKNEELQFALRCAQVDGKKWLWAFGEMIFVHEPGAFEREFTLV
jgi:hypothetical protein